MVKDILLYNKYHIVGVEGATNKNWDPQLGVKNFNIGHRTRYGITLHNRMIGSYETIPPTKKEFENRSYEYCVPEYNLLPGTQFIGIEDTTLYYFNSITLGTGSRSCSEYFCINQLVVSLRSHIAFYKIIQSALEQKTSHVAIVIGSAHMRDFMSLAKNYGVQTHFYNTSRTSFWKLILQE